MLLENRKYLDQSARSGEFLPQRDCLGSDYRIVRQLGRGGDGTVYLVYHLPTEQLRAAKCLKTNLPFEKKQELMVMKKLRHPLFPQVYDILESAGGSWLIMEYISGRCIADIPLEEVSAKQFFSIARQLSEALIYLHDRPTPILHLDIKPTNVLLKHSGELVLIDFGAAIASDQKNRYGGHNGTVGFAAPEQMDQKAKVDVRADIYGFGALMYYYLFKEIPKPPFIPVHQHSPKHFSCEKQILSLLKRCLQESPDERYPDSVCLYKELGRMQRRYERNRKLQKSFGAFALLLAAGIFTFTSMGNGDAGLTENEKQEKREESYNRILRQADNIGLAQAVEYYHEAFQLMPEQGKWCFQLFDRITEDYLFTEKEEMICKQLLFLPASPNGNTVLEVLRERFENFGELAYRIGLAYWYYYEGMSGKSTAVNWFQEAVLFSGDRGGTSWYEPAQIHIKIGTYYEKLGKRNERGVYDTDYGTYWEDLKKLWGLRVVKGMDAGIRFQIGNELLSCLIFHIHELQEFGEAQEECARILAELETFLLQDKDSGAWREEWTGQLQAAKDAVERAYGRAVAEEEVLDSERGNGD